MIQSVQVVLALVSCFLVLNGANNVMCLYLSIEPRLLAFNSGDLDTGRIIYVANHTISLHCMLSTYRNSVEMLLVTLCEGFMMGKG